MVNLMHLFLRFKILNCSFSRFRMSSIRTMTTMAMSRDSATGVSGHIVTCPTLTPVVTVVLLGLLGTRRSQI